MADERYYFDIFELQRELVQARFHSEFFELQQQFRLRSLKDLCGRLPAEGEIFFIETLKSFSAFTFIVYLLKQAGTISHLYIATYSTNERIIHALLHWHRKGVLGSIHLHMSETIKFRMPRVYERLQRLADEGVLTLSFAWSHKKITCIDTPLGKYVVEGSGNYGENALEEQYVFLKSDKVYEFHVRPTDEVAG